MNDDIKRNFGIYVHIPFCRQKCFYCDFASKRVAANVDDMNEQYRQYIEALCQEIVLYRELFPDIYVDTLYFGGGTPSILPVHFIEQVMRTLRDCFAFNPQAEITLEANPGTVDCKKLQDLYAVGLNRLSLGVQAAQNDLLQAIGRIHTIEQAADAVNTAQQIGFKNISIDLMYGLPQQTFAMLQQSVAWALDRRVQHISIYGLQVEENTVFGSLKAQGKLQLPLEEAAEKMYNYLTTVLPQYGYQRYEISNFAQQNCESRHNMAYWQDKPYLGLGAGAHGYYNARRVQNPFDIKAYIAKCHEGCLPYETEEIIDRQAHMEEFCFLALRTARGIDKIQFKRTFGVDIEEIYHAEIVKLTKQNLLINNSRCIALTEAGMKFGNLVFAEFLF